MLFLSFRKIVVLTSVLSATACSHPIYSFTKDEPKASVKLYNFDVADICLDNKKYTAPYADGKNEVLVPAGKRISIGYRMHVKDFSSWNFSCAPQVSFLPKAGKTYVAHFEIYDSNCYMELLKEDNSQPTGVALEMSLEKSRCNIR